MNIILINYSYINIAKHYIEIYNNLQTILNQTYA